MLKFNFRKNRKSFWSEIKNENIADLTFNL